MLKTKYLLVAILLILVGCVEEEPDPVEVVNENWAKRKATISATDSLEYGKSCLSIYSEIYSISEHRKHTLTAMVSMRNTSDEDTIYLLSAKYYDTHGELVTSHLNHPVYLAPLETTEIVIEESDVSGGDGVELYV